MIQNSSADDSLDVFDLASIVWHRKWVVIGVASVIVLGSGLYAFLATPRFRSEAVLSVNEPQSSPTIGGNLGELAGLVGIGFGPSTGQTEAIATLRSRVFVEDFIVDNDLLPVLFYDKWNSQEGTWISDDPDDQPTLQDGVEYFTEKVRFVSQDFSTELVTLAIVWKDPDVAADWVRQLIVRVNEQVRQRDLRDSTAKLDFLEERLEQTNLVELRQAISSLIEKEVQKIVLAQAETEYAFRVIDPPRVARKPDSPRRVLIIFMGLVLGGILGTVVASFRHFADDRSQS